MREYINYHKHDDDTNFVVLDVVVGVEDYLKRAVELGHKSFFTTNHGSMGDIFKAKTLCDKYDIKCYAGLEGYIVEDNSQKDKSNYHIVIVPKTNKARRKLNLISSQAHEFGYFNGRPRLDLNLLLSLDPNEYYITTACTAGVLKDPSGIENIFLPMIDHFKTNVMVEVQPHIWEDQIKHNRLCIDLARSYGLDLIAANDSHYIYPEQRMDRTNFLEGKKNWDIGEDSCLLDYPDYDTFVQRFVQQGIFSEKQAKEMIDRTQIFSECEEIQIDMSIKMPTAYPELSETEKIQLLKRKANDGFIKRTAGMSKEEKRKRIEGLQYEMSIIEQTSEVKSADYFLFNEKVVDIAVNKYDGILTRAGRGSGGCFYLNNVLGITEIDRFASSLPFYPERFASVARLLENKSMPDIDFNVAEQGPFVRAAKDLVGEYGVYPMFAYKQQGDKDAFKNLCRAKDVPSSTALTISQDLDSYSSDKKWKDLIEESKKQADTIVSVSVHPCAFVIMNSDIREEIGLIRCGDIMCAVITSAEADEYKYLKDDFLIVEVWKIISKTFKSIGEPILPLAKLIENLTENVWQLYDCGLTCTLNQIDGEWATGLVKKYKPRTVEELAMFIAAIRPAFASSREEFLKRKKHSSGVPAFDKIFEDTDGYIVFQENLMKYFEELGVTPAESIDRIKKISKKKIKPEDFAILTDRLKDGWIKLTGSDEHFQETWDSLQSALGYGFNVPHGYAYAIDSLYCAYLKANHPLEYYTVCFETYAKNIEKVKRLKHELPYFGISLEPVNFKKSRTEFAFDRDSITIYRGTNSLKSFDKKCIEAITELRHNEYIYDFEQLLSLAREKGMTELQLSRLIIIGFFSSFGPKEKLLYLMQLHFWLTDLKIIKKEELKARIPYISDFSDYAPWETKKTYKGIRCSRLISDLENMDLDLPKIPEKVERVLQVLHTGECEPSAECEGILVVLDRSKYASNNFTAYSLKRGEQVNISISKDVLAQLPVEKNDILTVTRVKKEYNSYRGTMTYKVLGYRKEKQKDVEKILEKV